MSNDQFTVKRHLKVEMTVSQDNPNATGGSSWLSKCMQVVRNWTQELLLSFLICHAELLLIMLTYWWPLYNFKAKLKTFRQQIII